MEELKIESKREKKREQLIQQLFEATRLIMQQYDYNTVTIRNICQVSKISYGSFYNLFKSKEEFLTYYLTHDFLSYKDKYYKEHTEFNCLNDIEKSIDIFKCCALYNIDRGIDFISAFYSSKNYNLSPFQDEKHYFCFTPLVQEGSVYLSKSIDKLKENADIDKIMQEYCLIFNGITFNWCVSKGSIPIAELIEEELNKLIKNYLR